MAGEKRSYRIPVNVSVQQVVQALGKMGYRYENRGIRHTSFTYQDAQDGKLLREGFTLRICMREFKGDREGPEGTGIVDSHRQVAAGGGNTRTWQLIRNGALFLTQASEDEKIPGVGAIADHISMYTAHEALLSYLWARVSEQEMLVYPPSPDREVDTGRGSGHILSDDRQSVRPVVVRFENWSFSSPFGGEWSSSQMILVLDGGIPRSETEYLHTLLQDYVGLNPVDFDPLISGLETIGAALPGVPVPDRYRLTPQDNVYTAIGKVLGKQAYKMWGNTHGTMYDLDIEFLHDLRVATRRARFALHLFSDHIGEERSETLRKELSWIAKSLGRVRDIDVFQEKFSEQFRKIGASEDIIQSVIGHYTRKRHRNFEKMREDLQSGRYEELLNSVRELEDTMLRKGRMQEIPVVEFVPGLIGAVLDRMSGWLDRSAESLSPNDLHELRIEFKGLRYTTEFFSDLYAREMRRVIRGFVQFQDCLGLYQDAQVATQTLRRFSEKIIKKGSASVDVMLGVGGLIQVQREIQERQQTQFMIMWQGFAGKMGDLRKLVNSHAFYTHA
jgi:CHAD domain-containing protein